jgi:two-component system nitrate/nitrite response regulator NarL
MTPSSARTRVLIIDDHVLFAESLELALSLGDFEVRRAPVGSMTPVQLLVEVSKFRPRVVLLDLDLGPLQSGVSLIAPIARTGVNVVVLTASTDKALWGECIRLGARKTLSKTQPLNQVLSVVRRISRGLQVMDAAERESLLNLWGEHVRQSQELRGRLDRLTHREQQVLGHLVAGHIVGEIARRNVVSEATVRTQVKSILAKLEVSSQLAAVGLVREAAWTPPPLEDDAS